MRVLTVAELESFLESAYTSPAPQNFHGHEEVFAEVLQRTGYLEKLVKAYLPLLQAADTIDVVGSLFLSLWATGFQIGREFESAYRDRVELERFERPPS